MRTMALLLGIMLATGVLRAQTTATVSGVVRDEGGAPIREALVVIDPDSLRLRGRTGDDGRFSFAGVPAGHFEVRVVRIGYRPQSRTIDVAGNALQVEFTLTSIPIPLDTVAVRVSRTGLYGRVFTRGIALLPYEPRPLRGARVQAVNEPHSVTTGNDGRFTMPLAVGSHGVLISLNGYATRLIPVSIAPDGGVEINVVLDSLYAEYQRFDEDQLRGITWRQNRATNPAAFISQHEIDQDAKNLRDAVRYSNSLLSRGVVLRESEQKHDSVCVYLNGKARTGLQLRDIDPKDVEALEVYPPGTIGDRDRLAIFPLGTPCENLWGAVTLPPPTRRELSNGDRRRTNRTRTSTSTANTMTTVIVWTRSRR